MTNLKMKKHIILLVVCLLSLLQLFSGTAVVDAVDTSTFVPTIEIPKNTVVPTGRTGMPITYILPLKNISPFEAKNVVITPVIDESTPIAIDSMNTSQTIDLIDINETKEVYFNFVIPTSAKIKTHQIKFNIQYYNYAKDYFSCSVIGYLKVEEGSTPPKLVLNTLSVTPSPVQAGKNFKLDISLYNQGTTAAKDIAVTLLGLTNDGANITGLSNKKTTSNLYGRDTSAYTFDLIASKKIKSGSNSLKIKLDYKDYSGSVYTDEIEFFYTVQDSGSTSNIELKNMVSPVGSLMPGDDALITFDVANTGDSDLQNVKVSLSSDKEILPRTVNTIAFPALKKGQSKKADFKLFISDEAVTKNYPVAITIEYDTDIDGTKTKQTLMQYVGLYVENKNQKSIPRLIIDKYNIQPQTIMAGQQFTVDLSILNTSRSSAINNIKVSLSSDDGTFTMADSNSFYVESIAPKASVSKKVVLASKPDSPAKQYILSINYEYEDEKGTALTSKDTLGIQIQQTDKLVIGELDISPEAFVGNPVPVNLTFYNMGKTTLYNLMVKLDGKFKTEGASYFVGNFEPGKTDTFDGSIIPEATGQIAGNVLFTYEDADGKIHEVKKDISVNVAEMPPPGQGMPEGQNPPAQEAKKTPLWAYIAGGAVIVAIIIVFIVIRKKIKARKELMFDEEL